MQQQISNLQVTALFGQLIDRISMIFKDAFIAVDKSDAALGRGRIHKGRIVGHQAKVAIGNFDLSQVQRFDRFVFNRDFVLLARAIVGNCQSVLRHWLESAFPTPSVYRLLNPRDQQTKQIASDYRNARAEKAAGFSSDRSEYGVECSNSWGEK